MQFVGTYFSCDHTCWAGAYAIRPYGLYMQFVHMDFSCDHTCRTGAHAMRPYRLTTYDLKTYDYSTGVCISTSTVRVYMRPSGSELS